jgi:MFS family permease
VDGTLFFVAPLAGALVDRFGERRFLVTGLGLQAAGMAWIALIADPGMAYAEMIPALMIAGCGVSMAMPSAQNVVSAVAPEAIGKAAGINSTMRELGGVFGIAVAVAVFIGAGGYASAHAFSDGFAPAIAASGGCRSPARSSAWCCPRGGASGDGTVALADGSAS